MTQHPFDTPTLSDVQPADLNLSGWIERRQKDVGPYASQIIKAVRAYEAELTTLRAATTKNDPTEPEINPAFFNNISGVVTVERGNWYGPHGHDLPVPMDAEFVSLRYHQEMLRREREANRLYEPDMAEAKAWLLTLHTTGYRLFVEPTDTVMGLDAYSKMGTVTALYSAEQFLRGTDAEKKPEATETPENSPSGDPRTYMGDDQLVRRYVQHSRTYHGTPTAYGYYLSHNGARRIAIRRDSEDGSRMILSWPLNEQYNAHAENRPRVSKTKPSTLAFWNVIRPEWLE